MGSNSNSPRLSNIRTTVLVVKSVKWSYLIRVGGVHKGHVGHDGHHGSKVEDRGEGGATDLSR